MAGKARNGQRDDDMDRMANGREQDEMSEHLILELVRQQTDRLAKHEEGCIEERREANRQRDDLRKEMRSGFGELKTSISKLHERINEVVTAAHAGEAKTWDWRLKTASALIALLLALLGSLVLYGRPWANLP